MAHSSGVAPDVLAKVRSYALLFWANRGNHNDYTAQKFLPAFTIDELKQAATRAQSNRAFKTAYADLPPFATPEAVVREIDALRVAFFDPAFEPTVTTKSPPAGKDIIQASANTFYRGVTLDDMQTLRERYALNSRVVKGSDGALREDIYRAGTPDGKVPADLCAVYLKKAIGYLEKARGVADPAQAKVIGELITFYQTGEFSDWLQFGGDWVRNDAAVDFANGFIEVYRDARGAKGSSQSFVTITDKPVTDTAVKLAQNAAYFEQKAPWDGKTAAGFSAASGEGRGNLVGDRRLSYLDGGRQPAERKRNPREVRHEELPVSRGAHALNAAAATKTVNEFVLRLAKKSRAVRNTPSRPRIC